MVTSSDSAAATRLVFGDGTSTSRLPSVVISGTTFYMF